jgi:hypothetical protein
VAGHVVEASRQGKSSYSAPKGLIARNAGVSVRTVTEANAELAAAGVITIERHFDGQRKQYDVSTYTLCTFRTVESGKSRMTPQANQMADNSPNNKENSTLYSESGISKEQAPPLGPGSHPAPGGASHVRDPVPPRPILNTW